MPTKTKKPIRSIAKTNRTAIKSRKPINPLSRLLQKVGASRKAQLLLVFVFLFAGIGVYTLAQSRAATKTIARTDANWAVLAEPLRWCETTGNYKSNTGNGYYGAYQFTQSTWNGIGGTGRPDQASVAEQDRLGKALFLRSGAEGQWPGCTKHIVANDYRKITDKYGRVGDRLQYNGSVAPPPTTANPGTVKGHAESANCRYVTGWAFDPDNKAANVRIDVYVDGPYAPGRAGFSGGPTAYARPDVNNVYGTTNKSGFVILIPEAYRDGNDHTLYVYGINTAGGGDNWVQAIRFTGCANPIGNTERFDCTSAIGWMLDMNDVNASLEYHVYVDGRYYTKSVANLPRQDVIDAYGNYRIGGNHGYTWVIPSALKDGKQHKIEIFGINRGNGNSNPYIGNSAKTMSCSRTYY